jgi:hypothetical protein
VDPDLRAYKGHLDYRWAQYAAAKAAIEANEGSVAAFARGHERYGFTRDAEAGATVYREWAPAAAAAALIGDFSGWEPVWMTKGDFGVWSVALPDGATGGGGAWWGEAQGLGAGGRGPGAAAVCVWAADCLPPLAPPPPPTALAAAHAHTSSIRPRRRAGHPARQPRQDPAPVV